MRMRKVDNKIGKTLTHDEKADKDTASYRDKILLKLLQRQEIGGERVIHVSHVTRVPFPVGYSSLTSHTGYWT